MFCPKCRYEYVEGVTQCSDCGSQLVPELPKEDPRKPQYEYVEWVPVFTPQDISESLVAEAILDEEGIIWTNKYSQTIHVPQKDAERATELLKGIEEMEIEILEEE